MKIDYPHYDYDSYVNHRLKLWGAWVSKILEQGMGYPARSIEGRLQADGGLLSRCTAPMQMPYNPDAEEMDNLINELGRYDKVLASVIRERYTTSQNLDVVYTRLQMSKKHFFDNVSRGRAWIAGRLSRK